MNLFLLNHNAMVGYYSILYAFTFLIFTILCGNSLLLNFTICKCELVFQSSKSLLLISILQFLLINVYMQILSVNRHFLDSYRSFH